MVFDQVSVDASFQLYEKLSENFSGNSCSELASLIILGFEKRQVFARFVCAVFKISQTNLLNQFVVQ